MAPRTRSIAFRATAGVGLVLGLHSLARGPAYTVKGAWEGHPRTLKEVGSGDISALIKALEPTVELPGSPGYTYGKWKFNTADGRLGVDYSNEFSDAKVNLHVDDDQSWKANISNGGYDYEVSGDGLKLDSLAWEATKSSSLPEVGDVKLRFNSNNKYQLAINRAKLAEIAGVSVAASAVAQNDGMEGRLDATTALPGGGDLRVSMSNPKGKYDFGTSTQEMEAKLPAGNGSAGVKVSRTGSNLEVSGNYNTPVAGGKMNVDVARSVGSALTYGASVQDLPLAGGQLGAMVTGDGPKQNFYASFVKNLQGNLLNIKAQRKDGAVGYDATFQRDISDMLNADAGIVAGVDDGGVYGRFTGAKAVLSDRVRAEYEASGRVPLNGADKKPRVAQSLKLSNKLGYAQLVHATGDEPKMRLGYEFDA